MFKDKFDKFKNLFFKIESDKNSPEIKEDKQNKYESVKTFLYAGLFAIFIRSLLFEPFHIPSSSMKPNLLIGDYIFVSKYSYGYSRYSIPFGASKIFDFLEGRIFDFNKPERGDITVFRLPSNPKINYVKRLVGLPGDKIQVINGVLYVNSEPVKKKPSDNFLDDFDYLQYNKFQEEIFVSDNEKKNYYVLDSDDNSTKDNTDIYVVPEGHYFMMGDNRDNSLDSRFLNEVGYVKYENLVGKAKLVFFSINNDKVWKFWNWHKSIRFSRIFNKI